MTTDYWIGNGGVEGKLTDAANWDAVEPGDADTAIFNAGSVDVDPSLGQLTSSLAQLLVYPGYTGNIGATGNEMDVGAGVIKFFGAGEFWWKDAGTSTDVYIRAADPSTVVNIGGNTAANLHCLRGTITIAGDVGNITMLTVGMKDNPTSDVTLDIVSNASTITDYYQYGGVVTSQMAMTRAEINNGIFTLNGLVQTQRLVVSGGQANYNSTGTITDMLLHGGRTDLGSTDKTITKSAIFPGAELVTDLGIHTYTTPLQDLRENVSGN